ncbi:hypothetical protein K504DRAFT_459583 [Pleomassaria siparia CBS 279.74]|uniref:Uncharacterized protein n=1 Tax=Pleomassaria siparia CBS 279.74 TaxID=1314801 RepID=A0A6G1K1F3_9PLEO|nr:hypothetical protein K504DRAFT_459583 [Pleomassaria siparia CBS 279.74]
MTDLITNLGPLPTTYSWLSRCNDAFFVSCVISIEIPLSCTGSTCTHASTCTMQLGVHCTKQEYWPILLGPPVRNVADCWPPELLLSAIDSFPDNAVYFSPGVKCPRGLTSELNGYVPSAFPSLGESESGIICCPSFLEYDTRLQQCRQTFTSTEATLCEGGTITDADTAPDITVIQSETQNPHVVIASAIQLRYHATDLANTSVPQPSPGGLGIGAKAGIGAGVPILVIGIIFVCLYLRRRRVSRTVPEEQRPEYTKPELDATTTVNPIHELGTVHEAAVHELPATQAPNRTYELHE